MLWYIAVDKYGLRAQDGGSFIMILLNGKIIGAINDSKRLVEIKNTPRQYYGGYGKVVFDIKGF